MMLWALLMSPWRDYGLCWLGTWSDWLVWLVIWTSLKGIFLVMLVFVCLFVWFLWVSNAKISGFDWEKERLLWANLWRSLTDVCAVRRHWDASRSGLPDTAVISAALFSSELRTLGHGVAKLDKMIGYSCLSSTPTTNGWHIGVAIA